MCLALVLVTIAAAGVFAQAKNAVSVDVAPLFEGIIASQDDDSAEITVFGIGVAYERLLVPHYSVGAGIDLYVASVNDLSMTYFGLNAHGRWYPLSESLEKLFLDTGLGFNTLNVEDVDDSIFTGLTFGLKAGWKLLFNKMIFAEPSIGYILAKSSSLAPITPLGWQIGLNIGAAF
jgi:hypothetical protein